VNRPRGLCWLCFYAPGVKDRYPSSSRYGRRGVGNIAGGHALPEPTACLPGTPEKVAVLAARAAAGLALFHPADPVFARGPAGGAGGIRECRVAMDEFGRTLPAFIPSWDVR
jgi:hypothetical protein